MNKANITQRVNPNFFFSIQFFQARDKIPRTGVGFTRFSRLNQSHKWYRLR